MGDLADKVNKYIHNKIKKEISGIKRLQKEKNYGMWDISLEGDKFDNENYKSGFLDARKEGMDIHIKHLDGILDDMKKYISEKLLPWN